MMISSDLYGSATLIVRASSSVELSIISEIKEFGRTNFPQLEQNRQFRMSPVSLAKEEMCP